MSEVNTEKKSETAGSGGLDSISNILDIINAAFSIPKTPLTPLPPPLVLTGSKLRVGVTASVIAARIIARQTEAGMVVGDVFGDGANTSEAMEVIRIEEIINSLLTEAKIEIAIAPGVSVTVTGIGNLGAPVLSQGATTTIASGTGVLR